MTEVLDIALTRSFVLVDLFLRACSRVLVGRACIGDAVPFEALRGIGRFLWCNACLKLSSKSCISRANFFMRKSCRASNRFNSKRHPVLPGRISNALMQSSSRLRPTKPSSKLLFPKIPTFKSSSSSSIRLASSPAPMKASRTSSLPLICCHSASLTLPSWLASIVAKASSITKRRPHSSSFSFSPTASPATTSQRTPISIFNSVNDEMKEKRKNIHIINTLCCTRASIVSARLSPRTPLVNNVIMESPMVANK
mmetsp:Transcript_3759/g.5826  ORF Transcript_3759/g.5826 Transcript_3759/m.5826 type:complete len:254 (+) Transcript_3759:356-1117(+)